MKTDIEIEYTFVEKLHDSYDEVKRVVVTTRSDEADEIIAAFIDFCRSIGVELKMDYTVPSSDKAH